MHVIRVGTEVDYQPQTEAERVALGLPVDYLDKRKQVAEPLKPAE